MKRVVRSQSFLVWEDWHKLRVKILIHEVGGTHCITHLRQLATQDLTFGNLIHSSSHIHSIFTQACVTAAFKKEDKTTHAQSCQVRSVCCCHSSGAGLTAVWYYAEEESEEPRDGIRITAASYDLPEESPVFGMDLLLP